MVPMALQNLGIPSSVLPLDSLTSCYVKDGLELCAKVYLINWHGKPNIAFPNPEVFTKIFQDFLKGYSPRTLMEFSELLQHHTGQPRLTLTYCVVYAPFPIDKISDFPYISADKPSQAFHIVDCATFGEVLWSPEKVQEWQSAMGAALPVMMTETLDKLPESVLKEDVYTNIFHDNFLEHENNSSQFCLQFRPQFKPVATTQMASNTKSSYVSSVNKNNQALLELMIGQESYVLGSTPLLQIDSRPVGTYNNSSVMFDFLKNLITLFPNTPKKYEHGLLPEHWEQHLEALVTRGHKHLFLSSIICPAAEAYITYIQNPWSFLRKKCLPICLRLFMHKDTGLLFYLDSDGVVKSTNVLLKEAGLENFSTQQQLDRFVYDLYIALSRNAVGENQEADRLCLLIKNAYPDFLAPTRNIVSEREKFSSLKRKRKYAPSAKNNPPGNVAHSIKEHSKRRRIEEKEARVSYQNTDKRDVHTRKSGLLKLNHIGQFSESASSNNANDDDVIVIYDSPI